ncbi:MAG TPA: hypothetical protein VF092_23590 [Longimicrobium sp.]
MARDGKESSKGKKAMQTAALLAGAAGLLLFIVGVKRRYRLDEEREIDASPPRARRRRDVEPELDEHTEDEDEAAEG